MSVAGLRRTYPYRLPAAGAPLRVCFVGHATLFAAGALHVATPTVAPAWVDTRDDDWDRVVAELAARAPHVVVVLRPHEAPHGAFAEQPYAVLGVAPDPLPRTDGPYAEGTGFNLQHLERADPRGVDRLLVCDPPSVPAAAGAGLPVWRGHPLPVDDRLFARPRRAVAGVPPRALFLGYSTVRVADWLLPVKHDPD